MCDSGRTEEAIISLIIECSVVSNIEGRPILIRHIYTKLRTYSSVIDETKQKDTVICLCMSNTTKIGAFMTIEYIRQKATKKALKIANITENSTKKCLLAHFRGESSNIAI